VSPSLFSFYIVYLLYPSDPLKTKYCDEFYAAEFAAMGAWGLNTSLFSLESFQAGSFQTFPAIPTDAIVIYRGWMLSLTDYESLGAAVSRSGGRLLTDTKTYLSTHHLPNWYPLISELTPETRIFPADADLVAELNSLGWNEYFIKDYVKSLKTSIGSKILSPEHAAAVITEMRRFRGNIEGGFCVRRVEKFLTSTEKRYFVMNSAPCSMHGEIPPIVTQCAARIQSRFFSVDVVERSDGELRVVEIGDGQVSDLVGWTPERFAKNLADHFGNKN
jgi:hypothetical protein